MASPEKSKRKKIGIVLLVLLLVIIASVIGYVKYRSTHIITDDAFIDGDIFSISSQIPGKVTEVLAHSNRFVEAGDVLFRLDTSDIEAELAAARANLEVVENQVAGQKAAIEVVKSQIQALIAQKELLDKEKRRFTNLVNNNNVSKDEYDRVMTQWKAIDAQIEAAENQRRQIEVSLGREDEKGNLSAVRLAQAQVARVELMLEHAVTRAPAAGYVTRKNLTVGQVIGAGQPVMSLVPLDDIYITANYKETDLTRVKAGQKVNFKVDAYPGEKFKGEVESIMAGTGSAFSLLPSENATGNYIKVVQRIPVRIKILSGKDDKKVLRLGMSVVPVILVEE